MEFLGFEISRKKDELRAKELPKAPSFVPPVDDDGTPVIQQQSGFVGGGAYGAYIDMEGGIKNEAELIRRYREVSLVPECDSAIEDIVNECITSDSSDRIVTLDLRDVKLSDSIKTKIQNEFYNILSMMKFNQNSHEIFRKWYVDGRIYFHKVVDSSRPKAGIVDLRGIDPLKIKKVRNVIKAKDAKAGVDVIKKVESKVEKGSKLETNQTFYHTGPHHDDIMLGLMPYVIQLIREPSNHHHFVNMTSGFTSVTNDFIQTLLQDTKSFLADDKIQMTRYDDFFDIGYKKKWDKDVFHYLDAIAGNNLSQQKRGMSHRLVRALIETYGVNNASELSNTIEEAVAEIQGYYDGEKNSKEIQNLKGMIREYEEELVWANYGVRVQDVHHLRLGFYQGDIFTENPQINRDVLPVLDQLKTIKPTVISVAFDPEGSGPDTHYKVLQTIAEAVRIWNKTEDLSELRIWGYRNVWYRFDVDEADIIVPVTLNSMAIMRSTFNNCYLSQKEASFPSYEFDGPFCDLSQNIWVKQHKDLQLLLGRDYWYQNKNPHLRAVHGVVNLKEMNVNQFLSVARKLKQQMEGSPV